MKKHVLIAILILVGATNIFGQYHKSKWVPSFSIDLSSDYENSYEYAVSKYDGEESSLPHKGALEIGGGIDYFLLKRLTIGATAKYYNKKMTGGTIKLGGRLKFFYTKNSYNYLALEYSQILSNNKDVFKDASQLKLGQYFGIAKIKDWRFILGVFFSFDDYNLQGSKPLFNKEEPDYITFHSWGISLGLAF